MKHYTPTDAERAALWDDWWNCDDDDFWWQPGSGRLIHLTYQAAKRLQMRWERELDRVETGGTP